MLAEGSFTLKLGLIRRGSNIAGHLRWFEYLASQDFIRDWYKRVEKPGFLQTLVDSARQIVQEDIYSKNTTAGTGRIKASFTGLNQRTSEGTNLIVFSDPGVAPSKGPFESGIPGEFSYAAFFENPRFGKYGSFIPDRFDPHDPRRFRPFYFRMCLEQSRLSNQGVVQRLFSVIRKHMPRFGQT